MNESTFTLKNDIYFKALFSKKGNEVYLKEFLTALLKLDIKNIVIKRDATLERTSIIDKLGILDLQAILNDNTTVDIEMQIEKQDFFLDRVVYYSSKLISEELTKGEEYYNINKVIIISILNHEIFETDNYITETVTVDTQNREKEIIANPKYYFIELPKFRKKTKDYESILENWLLFIDGEDKKGVNKVMERNNLVKKASEDYEYLTGDEELKRLAELREKAIKDEASTKGYAYRNGKEEGIKEGIKRGITETKFQIIKNMISEGISIEQISKITNLSIEEIKKNN